MHRILLAGIIALAMFLRFRALDHESLWFDEALSVFVATWDPRATILKLTELGFHWSDRNLFHLLLHSVVLLDRGEVAVRSISALSSTLSVLTLYALGKRLFDQKTALLGAFLLAISPLNIWYAHEARAYALATLLSLLAAYFMIRALSDDHTESWLGYIVLASMSVYTHAFTALSIIAFNVFALLRFAVRRQRPTWRWFMAHVVLALTLIPFARGVLGSHTAEYGQWIGEKIGRPTLRLPLQTLAIYSFGGFIPNERVVYYLGLLVFAALGLTAFVFILQHARREPERWHTVSEGLAFIILCSLIPNALLLIASFIQPVYLLRYLVPFLPPYRLLIAYAITALPGWRLRLAFLAAVVLVTIPALTITYAPEQKQDWRSAAAYIETKATADDLIVLYDAYMSIAFNHYYHGRNEQLLISRFAPDDELMGHVATIASKPRRVWLILSHADEKRLLNLLDTQPTARRTTERTLPGVRILAYEVKPLP